MIYTLTFPKAAPHKYPLTAENAQEAYAAIKKDDLIHIQEYIFDINVALNKNPGTWITCDHFGVCHEVSGAKLKSVGLKSDCFAGFVLISQ